MAQTPTPQLNITSPSAVLKMNCLVFGPSGQGKTTFLGTAMDDKRTTPTLIVDFEGGLSSIADRKVDVRKITKWDDFRDTVRFLKESEHKYKSVCIDSISESHVFALMRLLEGDKRRTIQDLLEPGDYGQALVQMRRLLRDFRDLPVHFFATALAKSEVDPKIGTVSKPSLVGALADEAPGIFDFVVYLATQDATDEKTQQPIIQRVLVLQNIPQFRTKVRIPRSMTIPDSIVDPSVAKLLDVASIK